MIINAVGNYGNGYVGEIGDLNHIVRELEALGHTVQRVPQDIWKAWVDGERNPDWESKLPIKSDFNLITKWHHFIDGRYIHLLKEFTQAPTAYWLWDYMDDNGFPIWHMKMAQAADLYLTNEYGLSSKYKSMGIKPYYFPFDVCDEEIPVYSPTEKKYDVVFLGSCIGQGHRIEYLTAINRQIPVTCFSWNPQDWQKLGVSANPAVYGAELAEVIAQSKVILGFSVNPYCWGYWSNRVGKVLRAGGCLLYEFAPGMELALGDAADYFADPEEALVKIQYYLDHKFEREAQERLALAAGERFTSKYRVKQLDILINRYLKTGGKDWSY